MPERIPALLYHRVIERDSPFFDRYCVSPRRFHMQMQWLYSRGYRTVEVSDYIAFQKRADRLPPRRFLLTFDDGYEDVYRVAFPILKKYGFFAAVFLIADAVEQSASVSPRRYLTYAEIEEMRAAGCEFHSHGVSHRVLTTLSRAEIRDELVTSRRLLGKVLGAVDFFAYPQGRVNEDIVEEVRAAGYRGAFSGQPAWSGREANDFMMGRTEIFETDALCRFRWKIRTGYGFMLYLRKLAGRIKKSLRTGNVRGNGGE